MNELYLFLFVTTLILSVFIGVLLSIIPALTRRSFLFGVKIPPAENQCTEARRLKKNYAASCLCGTAVIAVLTIVLYLAAPQGMVYAILYFPLLLLAVCFAAFIPKHRAALRLKSERNWAPSDAVFAETRSSVTRGALSNLPRAWYIVSLLIIAASMAVLLARYPLLPERIATHYGFDMLPDKWADKSIGRVLFLPLINLLTLALLLAVGIIIEKARLQIDADKPALSFAQHRVYRRRMGHALGFLTLGVVFLIAALDLPNLIEGCTLNFWALNLLWFVPTAVLCVTAIGSGQGGCRIKIRGEAHEGAFPPSANISRSPQRSDDRFWALGMFYHNPDDPAVFVEHRFGGSLGFNYSRLSVKIGAAISALAVIAIYIWATIWWAPSVLQ